MKIFKKISYIVLIIFVIGLCFLVYKVTAKDEQSESEGKTLSEVKYVEQKLVELFNSLNNISYDNYTITSKAISDKKSSQSGSSSGGSKGGEGMQKKESSGSSESSSSSGEESSSSSSSSSSSQNAKEYELTQTGILTGNKEIDWETIQNETETTYTMLSNLTLDLYQVDIEQNDILGFNAEYDNLTKAVKEKDKQKTLVELSKLYEYLPKFIDKSTNDNKEKTIINTKNHILRAYSNLEKEDWKEISKNINNAIEEYSKILIDVSSEDKNQYNINKAYVMISELKNCINLKDKEIFLIKYRNILEEFAKM